MQKTVLDCSTPAFKTQGCQKKSEFVVLILQKEIFIKNQIDGKENGVYILLSKFEEDVVFEYHITVRDEDFNLGILTMRTPEGVFEADFDA